MQPNELLKILAKLKIKGRENLHHQLKPCGLQRKSESYSSSEEVKAKVTEFKPIEGWLCFQSEIKYFCKGETMPDSGILLYGEVVNADGASLHIREDGQGNWILTTFTEIEGGEKYLVETKEFLGEKELAPEKLSYRVYWQDDAKHGYYQFAARFIGFEKQDK